jgi:hypothetical protein
MSINKMTVFVNNFNEAVIFFASVNKMIALINDWYFPSQMYFVPTLVNVWTSPIKSFL